MIAATFICTKYLGSLKKLTTANTNSQSYSLAFLPYSFLSHSSTTGFSLREPERTTAALGRSASPGVEREVWKEVGVAGIGPELLLGVAGVVEGVAEPDPKLYVKALGVVGVGGADT